MVNQLRSSVVNPDLLQHAQRRRGEVFCSYIGQTETTKAFTSKPALTLTPSGEANRPTVDGYSTLSRGLVRALLARQAVAASKR